MHWCMHLPRRRRRLERSGVFFRLNGHHLLITGMHKNFNVVLPLADLFSDAAAAGPYPFCPGRGGPRCPTCSHDSGAPKGGAH